MRIATLLTLLAAPLALAACDSSQDTPDTENMPMAENMPSAEDMPMARSTEAGQTASGEGTVTAIDSEAGTITIDHGAIEAVNWPAMTMGFKADEASRQQVAVGDEVEFAFLVTEGGGEITSISKK